MSRMFLVCPARPGFKRMALEVISYDRARNRLTFRWPDGHITSDDVFHIDVAKRAGYILTAETPPEFTSTTFRLEPTDA